MPNGNLDITDDFSQGEVVNDFVISGRTKDQQHRGRHMYIRYDFETQDYLMKDLGVGSGTFLKVDYPVELIDNHLVNMGETYILFNIIQKQKFADILEIDAQDQSVSTMNPPSI